MRTWPDLWYILWSKSKLNKLFFIPANLKVCRDNRSAIMVSVKIVRNYCKIMIHWSASLLTYFHRKTGSLCRNIYSLLDLIHKSCAFFHIVTYYLLYTSVSMTSLFAHKVAQLTKWSFLPKNLSQLVNFVIGLAFTWV